MKKQIYSKYGSILPKKLNTDKIEMLLWKEIDDKTVLYRIGYITEIGAIGLIQVLLQDSERFGRLYVLSYPEKEALGQIRFNNSKFKEITHDYFAPYAKYKFIEAGFQFIVRAIERYEETNI